MGFNAELHGGDCLPCVAQVLENDAELDLLYPFTKYVKGLEAAGHEIQIIYNAYSSADQIVRQYAAGFDNSGESLAPCSTRTATN